jgi:hypothetical protein
MLTQNLKERILVTTKTFVVWRVVLLATGVVASGPVVAQSNGTADSAVSAYLGAVLAVLRPKRLN